MYQLRVDQYFSAAHSLRGFKSSCEALHGHNWRVRLIVEGEELDEIGLIMDFKELKSILGSVLDKLDHTYLNEVEPFDKINPSSELIAEHIYKNVSRILPLGIRVLKVLVWESRTSCAVYME